MYVDDAGDFCLALKFNFRIEITDDEIRINLDFMIISEGFDKLRANISITVIDEYFVLKES